LLAVGCDAKITGSGFNETTTVTSIYEANNALSSTWEFKGNGNNALR
jgi:hypothetical protein